MNRFAILLLLTPCFPCTAHATEHPPADHGGGDLTLANGDVIWGEHTNIGTFTVPFGATVSVKFYDGTSTWEQSNTPTGTLTVHADHILIDGHLKGDGAGYSGGGGGGGGGTYQWPGGAPGWGRYQFTLGGGYTRGGGGQGSFQCGFGCGASSSFDAGPGGPGDGHDFGYPEGFDDEEWWQSCGGYLSGWRQGTNGDTTTDESIVMGSGGAGTPGCAGGYLFYPDGTFQQTSGCGGAAGGSGGGAISLTARVSLRVGPYGKVTSNGTMGGYFNQAPPSPGLTGRRGADAYPYDPVRQMDTTDWYNSGGSGAGGGILLKCDHHGGFDLRPGAVVSSIGGGGLFQNGGTVKLFYVGVPPSEDGVTITTPRKFLSGGASAAVLNWMMYE